MKWIRSKGYPWDVCACAGAADGGHLELLKWLRSEGCPWDEMTCVAAAGGGHLEVLNGSGVRAALGMKRHALVQLGVVTWRY